MLFRSERKRLTLPPERLREVLERLNEVLAEAERLRDQITSQIESRRRGDRQQLSAPSRRKRKKTRRS